MPVISHTNRREVEQCARQYNLLLPERQNAMRAGELAGRNTGASIEFQDRKDYTAGDDTRHIDWRAFARTDRLTIKLYREEICPMIDIIVDTSSSMSVSEDKIDRRQDLLCLFHMMSKKIHATSHLYALGESLTRLIDPYDVQTLPDEKQMEPMPTLQRSGLARRAGTQIFISDFLFPFTPRELTAVFSRADRLICIQLLSDFESDPSHGGNVRLEDAESGDYMDVMLNRATVDGYLSRLSRLQEDMDQLLRKQNGAFVILKASNNMQQITELLLRSRIIEV